MPSDNNPRMPLYVLTDPAMSAGMRSIRRGRGQRGGSQAPMAGPLTTLLVTDVQNSTVLWETVPSEVMDRAYNMHHACIRRLLQVRYNLERWDDWGPYNPPLGWHSTTLASSPGQRMPPLPAPHNSPACPALLPCLPRTASPACHAQLPCLPRTASPACPAQEHGGYENLTEGDSFICSFHGPTCAVEFARRCQKHLLRLDWCGACGWLTDYSVCARDYLSSLYLSLRLSIGTSDPPGIHRPRSLWP